MIKDEWNHLSFRTQSLKREYKSLVQLPRSGAFSLTKSCLGCRYLLLRRAARYMERIGADFVCTGGVDGTHGIEAADLREIEKRAGLEHRVLRPLYDGFPLTQVRNLEMWSGLPDSPHTSAGVQEDLLELAEALGLDPSDPASHTRRCKLTVPGFGDRVANLFGEPGFTLNALRLLDFPLYYKIAPDTKLVIATDEQSKRELQNLFLPQDLRIYPPTPHGPMTLVRTAWSDKGCDERARVIELAARITATYLPERREFAIPIYYRFESEDERWLLNVAPFESVETISALACVEVAPSTGAPSRAAVG